MLRWRHLGHSQCSGLCCSSATNGRCSAGGAGLLHARVADGMSMGDRLQECQHVHALQCLRFLCLLIDQTPRDQVPLRSALQARLGAHYEFQAAQRLAEQRLEDECAHSCGRKWFMLIDKMDQQKTVCPRYGASWRPRCSKTRRRDWSRAWLDPCGSGRGN